jgi:predicted RNase H-like HicB family nuclease
MVSLSSYTIVIKPDDNGIYVAYVPAIPGCHAIGLTSIEAQAALEEVFLTIAEEYEEEKRTLPPDVPLKRSEPLANIFRRSAAKKMICAISPLGGNIF